MRPRALAAAVPLVLLCVASGGRPGANAQGAAEASVDQIDRTIDQLRGKALTIASIEPRAVTAYVLVVGQDGQGVEGLDASHFAVMERTADGTPNPVFPFFTTVGESQQGISVGLTMDYSASMAADDLRAMEEANRRFVGQLRPDLDHVSVTKFATTAQTVYSGPPTGKKAEKAIRRRVGVGGKTALVDAVNLAYDQVDDTRDMKLVVAFTDGRENSSTVSLDEITARASEYQAPVLAVGLGDKIDHDFLLQLAGRTGGFYVHVPHSDGLIRMYEAAVSLLKGAYVLRWKPSHPPGTSVAAAIFVQSPAADEPVLTGLTYVAGTSMAGSPDMLRAPPPREPPGEPVAPPGDSGARPATEPTPAP